MRHSTSLFRNKIRNTCHVWLCPAWAVLELSLGTDPAHLCEDTKCKEKWKNTEGLGLVQPVEKKLPTRRLSSYLQGGYQKDRAEVFTEVHGKRMRDNRQKLKWQIQTGYKETLLHTEGRQASEQVAQRGSGACWDCSTRGNSQGCYLHCMGA